MKYEKLGVKFEVFMSNDRWTWAPYDKYRGLIYHEAMGHMGQDIALEEAERKIERYFREKAEKENGQFMTPDQMGITLRMWNYSPATVKKYVRYMRAGKSMRFRNAACTGGYSRWSENVYTR